MSNIIKLKNSGTASATPNYLEYGELALNYNDEKIFYKNSLDEIVEFSLGGASIGGIEGTVYNSTIGNGSDTSYVLTHNFGSRDVSVTIREANSPYGLIIASWEATSTNAITVYFDEAPASSSIRVSVYIAVAGLEVGPTGPTGPTGPPGPTGPTGPIGPAGLNWVGAWSDGAVSYSVDDAVEYNGSSYMCISSHISGVTILPTDDTYWDLLVSIGNTGPTGPTGPPGTLGSAVLNDLFDVSVSTPSTGNFLQWDGSQWIATSNSASFNEVTAGGITAGVVGSTTISTDSGDLTISPASLVVNIGNDLVATGTVTGSSVITNSIVFEGSTVDSNETTLQVLDPTADRTISLPDATGTVALSEIIITEQTASYTLALTDKDKLIEVNVGSANNLTIPPESSVNFPIGSQVNILQTGTGQTTIVAGAGVTVNATPGLKLRARWSSVTLIKRASDTWVALGDLQA